MAIVVLESIGFCATHSISAMLRLNGKNFVSHGTKNFIKNTPMGVENLSFEEFHNQMVLKSDHYENCISVHSNYPPEVIAKLVDGTATCFFGLMRKSQSKQILSCFYWAANGFLSGREEFTEILSKVQRKHGNSLRQVGLPVNMNSCLMFYAFQHVLGYNLQLLKYATKILFFEDLLENPTFIADLFGMGHVAETLKLEKGPSHKDKVKEFHFLSNAEETLDVICSSIKVNVEMSSLTIQEVEQLFIKKSTENIAVSSK